MRLVQPRTKLVGIIFKVVVGGNRYQNFDRRILQELLARSRHRARMFPGQISWQSEVLPKHYTRAFEAHRERGRKLTGWYCWGHGTSERSRRCTHNDMPVSQSHALLSITVLNSVYVYKYFEVVRNFEPQNNQCRSLPGFFQSNFDSIPSLFRFPPRARKYRV